MSNVVNIEESVEEFGGDAALVKAALIEAMDSGDGAYGYNCRKEWPLKRKELTMSYQSALTPTESQRELYIKHCGEKGVDTIVDTILGQVPSFLDEDEYAPVMVLLREAMKAALSGKSELLIALKVVSDYMAQCFTGKFANDKMGKAVAMKRVSKVVSTAMIRAKADELDDLDIAEMAARCVGNITFSEWLDDQD